MSKTTSKKHSVIDYKIDPKRSYTFRLRQPTKGNYIIPNEALCWDEEEGRQRRIRLSSTEQNSPYLDDQKEGSITSTVSLEFKKGVLVVSGKEPHKIKYLLAWDGNAAKKEVSPNSRFIRFKYDLVDETKEFKSKADLRKFKLKLQNAIIDASYDELKDFLSATYGYTPKTEVIEELVEVALLKVDLEPEVVNTHFKSEETKLKSSLIQAFKDKILIANKDTVTWADTGLEIGVFKPTEDKKLTDVMVDWVSKDSKEAKDFIKKLAVRRK